MDTEPTGDGAPAGRISGRLGRAAWLVILLAISAGLVAWFNLQTRERVARNEAGQVMKALVTVLPAGSFDNHPDQDRVLVRDESLLGSDQPMPVYRARLDGKINAVVVSIIARQGYVGPIRLLVALAPDGTVLAVRAQAHQETPGLGDGIDIRRSDWIRTFSGLSLSNPGSHDWAVRRDGGQIDQITGATITSRAVVNAVRNAALVLQQHKAEIFTPPGE